MDSKQYHKMILDLIEMGNWPYAEAISRQWLESEPDNSTAFRMLLKCLYTQKQWPGVFEFLVPFAQRNSFSEEIFLLMGQTFKEAGVYPYAEQIFVRYLARHPQSAEALRDYAVILLHTSRVDQAETLLRKAVEISPSDTGVWAWLMEAIDYNPRLGAKQVHDEKKKWNDAIIAPLREHRRRHLNNPDPDRVLRIGYLSPNFYEVSPSRIFGPIMWAHDRSLFKVICINAAKTPLVDSMFKMFQEQADEWHDTGHMTDEELADYIREIKIDILIDLSGHGEGNRLQVFGRKPAPIQVSAWSFATGTGAETMDYLIADKFSVPESEYEYFAEKIANLPCVICCQVPAHVDEISALPAGKNGYVTFGSFNRIQKIDDQTARLWSEILNRVPGSRLVIKDIQLANPDTAEFMTRRFVEAGISADRLNLRGFSSHAEHMKQYRDIDIGLDPLVHGGALTTCEALMMGVPTVCLYGNSLARRQTYAINSLLGLTKFNCHSLQDYADCAVGWAGKLDELASLRSMMRPRYQASPVGNPQLYARHLEDNYRHMWRNWCSQASAA